MTPRMTTHIFAQDDWVERLWRMNDGKPFKPYCIQGAGGGHMAESNLMMFTGTECTHCHEMEPLLKRLEKEEKVKIERLEVWHNAANMKKLQELDQGRCGGIPFFWNSKTQKFICGSAPYEKLKEWAIG